MKNLVSDKMIPIKEILNICQMNMTEAFLCKFTNFYKIELLFYNSNK